MASVPSPSHLCSAETEKPLSRTLRLAGTVLLTAQAVLLTGVGLLVTLDAGSSYRAGNALFLAASLSLLSCSLWSFHQPAKATRWLFLPCLACFIALFFTDYAHNEAGFNVNASTGTSFHNGAVSLAGLILMCMVLSRFLRWSATRAACNCG